MADRDEAIRRAREAERLLEEPLLVEVLAGLEAEAIRAWRFSDPADTAARETAYHNIAAVERLKKALRTLVEDGGVAKKQIAQENARKEAEKRGQA